MEVLSEVLDCAPLAMAAFRPATGKIVYANRAFATLTGIRKAQLGEKSFFFCLGRGSRARVQKALESLLDGTIPNVQMCFTLEVPLHPARDIEITFTDTTHTQGRPVVCAYLRDVSGHRQQVEDLEFRVQRLEKVIDASLQPVLVTNMKGLIRRCNRGARRMLEFTAEELVGKKYIQDLYEGDADQDILATLRTTEHGPFGVVDRYQTICISKSRERIPVWVFIHILIGQDGEEVGIGHFINDMRHVTEMERKLEEVQLQLIHADKMASLGKLAAGVAHEINNPLGGILLFGGLLLEDMDFSDPRHEDASRIVQEARRCKEIVNSLLDFAHQRKRYYEPVDLHAALEQCLTLLGNKANFHNITVNRRFADALPFVTGNPSQIKQVFTNIISNAVDAMDGEGQLSISTFVDIEGQVGVTLSDTGPGIPTAVRNRIFDPFFTTKEPGKGTGLGLSLSYNIIKMHHGDIRLDSPPGGGAEFTIVFPANEEVEL